jgi:DNA-binding CsgD family transcriptional regulator/tetratricopeptide (TPR) repeat protein
VGGVLVGRSRERRLLNDRVAEVTDRSSALLVVGEAGIGKTRLVEQAAAEAAESGVRLLRGACSPLSGDVPYAPLQVVVVSAAESAEGTPSPPAPGTRSEWYAVLDRTLALAPGGSATLLLVEDVHWADASTLGYLAHLSRNLPPAGLVVVMTFREDGGTALHETWLAEQRRCPDVGTVDLDPLTRDETGELLRVLRPEVTDGEAGRLHERSGGNPYLATELAFTVEGDDELPRTLRQVLGAVLRQVGPAARDVVAAALAIGRAATEDELGAAVGDPGGVREARQAHLLEAAPGIGRRWRARHPVLAELAYDALPTADRRALHARLALVAEAALPAEPGAAHLGELARHHLEAGHSDDTLVWSVRAAQAAEAECGFAEAGRWYAVAVDAWPTAPASAALVPERSELVEAAGRNLSVAGRHHDVITLVDPYVDPEGEVSDGAGAGGTGLAALLVHRSWSRFVEGDTDGARADIDRAVAALDPAADAHVAADVFAQRGMIEITCSDVAAAGPAAEEALRFARASGNTAAWGRATAILGGIDLFAGRTGQALTRLDDGLRAAVEAGDADGFALSAVVVAGHHAESSSPTMAVRVIEALRGQLRTLAPDGHWLDEMITGNLVVALADAGLWDRARHALADTSPVLGFAEIQVALVDARAGRADDALAALHRWAGLDRRDQPQFHLMFGAVRGELSMVAGRLPDVVAEADDALGYVTETPELLLNAMPLLLTGMRAAARLSDRVAVERLAAGLLAGRLGPIEEAVRAQVAAERARPPDSGDLWEKTADAWATRGRPYEEALARLRAGEAHLAGRGRRRQATAALSAARDIADLVGCPPVLDEVTRLAQAARLPVSGQVGPAGQQPATVADGATSMQGLTEREIQVLALVAGGHTNRQIGDELYMSPKTASVHVTRILQKLGVSTRVQAATVAVQRGLVPKERMPETTEPSRP